MDSSEWDKWLEVGNLYALQGSGWPGVVRGAALEGTSCWLDGSLPSLQNKAERASAAFFIPDLPLNTPRVMYVQLLEGSEILS